MAGELELEWVWARGSLELAAAGHFGRMAGARVGLGSLVDDWSKCGHERDSSVLCARPCWWESLSCWLQAYGILELLVPPSCDG